MKIILVAALFAATLFAQATEPARQTVEGGFRGQVHVLTEDVVGATPGQRVEARKFVFSTGAQTMEFVSAMNVGPLVVKAPYSSETVTESVQTLYDGNRIVHRESTKQFRDSEGRERREEGGPLKIVFITDPVAKANYTLHPDSKTAEKMGGPGIPPDVLLSRAVSAAPTNAVTSVRVGPPTDNEFFYVGGTEKLASPAPKQEDLGTRMIEGVEAKGTRTTSTIAAGEIGNDRPIEIVDERWYSPDLQLTVLTRHIDPRSGENTYKLINIQRIEQVRSLFEIPPGYTVHEPPVFTRAVKEE